MNLPCEFPLERSSDGVYHCLHCNQRIVTPNDPAKILPPLCRARNLEVDVHATPPVVEYHPDIEPSLGVRLINFTIASIAHAWHCCPTVTDEELIRRGLICRGGTQPDGTSQPPCEHFTGIHCAKCGCFCGGQGKRRFFDKLAWADQHCPIGKW